MALRGRLQKGTLVAWQGKGMAYVNQTRPHYVNQMGKTQSHDLAERHGRETAGVQQGNGMGTAWERHGMCESAFTVTVLMILSVETYSIVVCHKASPDITSYETSLI
jgi:hypothetical protein